MRESMVYSEADLGPFRKRLAELRTIVQNDAPNHPPAMIHLLEKKLNQCGKSLPFYPLPILLFPSVRYCRLS